MPGLASGLANHTNATGRKIAQNNSNRGKDPLGHSVQSIVGTDFLIARDGKIAAIDLFFDGPGDAARPNGPSD